MKRELSSVPSPRSGPHPWPNPTLFEGLSLPLTETARRPDLCNILIINELYEYFDLESSRFQTVPLVFRNSPSLMQHLTAYLLRLTSQQLSTVCRQGLEREEIVQDSSRISPVSRRIPVRRWRRRGFFPVLSRRNGLTLSRRIRRRIRRFRRARTPSCGPFVRHRR